MAADHDLAQIELTLGRLFPELRVAPIRVLETGFESLVVETRGGAIFRVARHERAAEGHAREARLLPVLGPRLPVGVPIPRWRVEPGLPSFPFGAMGYRGLAGQPLRPEAGRPRQPAGRLRSGRFPGRPPSLPARRGRAAWPTTVGPKRARLRAAVRRGHADPRRGAAASGVRDREPVV